MVLISIGNPPSISMISKIGKIADKYIRPYHAYCIYVGTNTQKPIATAIKKLISCYQKIYPHTTIFLASKVEAVYWGKFSLLKADLQCMEDLLKLSHQ